MTEVNAELRKILDEGPGLTPPQCDQLYTALITREDEFLDALRFLASQMGLMPGITAHQLSHLGLGTPIQPEVHDALVMQADMEMEALAAAIREQGGEIGGGPDNTG
jgi:hypothetical protein